MFKHASIIPLIGGELIGSMQAYDGERPTHILSYSPFKNNDSHILNYLGDIEYHLLDEKGSYTGQKADVISSVCPCAGLSQMSNGFGDHNPNNEWMIKTAEYVLGDYKPMVFWGENARGLAGKIGENVRKNLRNIGKKNGYSMSLYRTKSMLHGIPQVRERTFYFFWRGNKVPLFEYYNRPYEKIEDLIRNVKSNNQHYSINERTPSKDPFYSFILNKIHDKRTHAEHSSMIEPTTAREGDSFSYIERHGYDYLQVAEWMKENGFSKEVDKCIYKYEKLKSGKNIMRRGVIVPKDYIGAFVGHYPTVLTHPDDDRFITYREAMTIMGLPSDFSLLDERKSVNHICQNVPVATAKDMATEVRAVLEGKRTWENSDFMIQYNGSKILEKDENDSLEHFYE